MATPLVESPRLSIFVVEEGGLIGDRAERIRRAGGAAHIFRQHREEHPESFARRCRAQLRELEEKGAQMDEATLIGGGTRRKERTLSRAALIRALTAQMVRLGRGTLTLTGRDEDRRVMESLAEIMREQIVGAGVEIRAVFEGSSERERPRDDGARMTRP